MLINHLPIVGQSQGSKQLKLAGSSLESNARETQNGSTELKWIGIQELKGNDDKNHKYLSFVEAKIDPHSYLPMYNRLVPIDGNILKAEVTLSGLEVEALTPGEVQVLEGNKIGNEFEIQSTVRKSARENYVLLEILPLRKRNGKYEKLISFDIFLSPDNQSGTRDGARDKSWASNSVLGSGEWFKISTGEDGIYQITGKYLRECGFQINNLASSSIRLFGIKAGMMSPDNAINRQDDLYEIPIMVNDGNDGIFDGNDYFLFFGEDQVKWDFVNENWSHQNNYFSDSAYYFITLSGGVGDPKRITSVEETSTSNRVSTTYDYYDFHESDNVNLIKSGREWYGEQLGLVSSYDFGFSIPNVDLGEKVNVKARIALRSVSISGSGVTLSLPSQGSVSDSILIKAVPSSYASQFAKSGTASISILPKNADFLTKVAINYGNNPSAQAWIDYIELSGRRSISFLAPSMKFRDTKSIGAGNVSRFVISNSHVDLKVWDITNVLDVKDIKPLAFTSGKFEFNIATDSLKEFIAFNEEAFMQPNRIGFINNQNLHSLTSMDYLVITHPSFKTYADEIAKMHEDLDGFTTAVINVNDIYNEFSGGAQDITAIREFIRMIYARGQGTEHPLEYLLLFGDASYDYKDRVSGNSNFVPSHQTLESLIPTASVVSDDYFGLLDDNESESPADLVDISIGRLPARNRTEAQRMVEKIKNYSTSKSTFGDWRNMVTLVADDPEGFRADFQEQSSTLGALADSLSPEFNIQKIYLDAYKQVSGSGGERYPDAAEAISKRVGKGALMMYYIGHGGELGWAHERVLEVPTINKWDNFNNLPLFITATCEFTRFDDPRRTSAGEYVMLNPSGGGVALLTTTRAVYSGPNFQLTHSFTRQAFDALSHDKPRLGDMTRQTKIENASTGAAGNNTRCFALMGDPAMRLAFPQQNIIITSIPDTLKALDKVKVKGYIASLDSSVIPDFNGLIYPTLYDKISTIQGQNNDGQGVFYYQERRNILFKGKASVKDGHFEFEFVVPKDINREYGQGKLSLYAQNGSYDASGADFSFMIGGLSDNPVQDNDGPSVELFMNNNKFVFGGMTNEDPDLYAEVWDENGVNMVGTGIGHDITAVLDEKGANTIVLNDYFESDVDSYQSGKIRYPFNELEEGRHTLKLQVWDVNNNPGDATTEFIVANDQKFALDHVLNYPNPFTTNTDFFFEHNKPGLNLQVRIEIFTVSGKLVKSIDGSYMNDGYRIGPINWNGKDDFGDQIAKGVYVYRVSVKTPVGEHVEAYEKLVILK